MSGSHPSAAQVTLVLFTILVMTAPQRSALTWAPRPCDDVVDPRSMDTPGRASPTRRRQDPDPFPDAADGNTTCLSKTFYRERGKEDSSRPVQGNLRAQVPISQRGSP